MGSIITIIPQAVHMSKEASFFDTYRTYDEHNAFLDQLASTYPNLVTKKVHYVSCECMLLRTV